MYAYFTATPGIAFHVLVTGESDHLLYVIYTVDLPTTKTIIGILADDTAIFWVCDDPVIGRITFKSTLTNLRDS